MWRSSLSFLRALQPVADLNAPLPFADLHTGFGFAPDGIGIEPRVWDPVVTAYSVIEFNPLRKVLRPIVLGRALIGRKRAPGAWWSDFPMGYYVTAVVP